MIVETSSRESIYECTKFCKDSTFYVAHTFTQPGSDQRVRVRIFCLRQRHWTQTAREKSQNLQTNTKPMNPPVAEKRGRLKAASSRDWYQWTYCDPARELYSYFEIFNVNIRPGVAGCWLFCSIWSMTTGSVGRERERPGPERGRGPASWLRQGREVTTTSEVQPGPASREREGGWQ